MSQQQTILRVQTTVPHLTISGETQYVNLDLYSDIPIKINKSFAELQDISKKNVSLTGPTGPIVALSALFVGYE